MIGITEYIEQIYKDFSEYYNSGHNMCELKGLTFQAGGLPDYNNIRIQQFYLLRYAFAYSFEYSYMYSELIKNFKDRPNIFVASIGCGAMIDYWSLAYTLEKYNMQNCSIRYVGLDKINWNYKIPAREKDEIHFNLGNVKDFFEKNEKFISDIYFFPKSISEFNNEEMNVMLDNLSQKPIIKDNIYFCISIRADQGSRERDLEKINNMIHALKKNGLTASIPYNTYTYFIENKGLFSFDSKFVYPAHALEYIKTLNEKCASYLEHKINCKNDCKSYLTRSPILKTGNIYYQIIKFERK